jgi:hypothetical protein
LHPQSAHVALKRKRNGPCRRFVSRSPNMNPATTPPRSADAYELRFASLFDPGRALAFPCDGAGRVDLHALSKRARCNYLRARHAVGRDLAWPSVQPRATH